MNKQEYFQKTFLGGMNQQVDPTRLAGDSYNLGINIRVRKDVVEPIKMPLDLSNISPEGIKKQGLFAAGTKVVLIQDGKAYVKDYENPTAVFILVPDFQLSADADYIYAELVPASTLNFGRQYTAGATFIATGQQNLPSASFMLISDSLARSGSLAAGIFQDGSSQPRGIQTNGDAFVTKPFDQWILTERSYVPIGKQMTELDGILYIVAPDGRSIYRSVSGRPLDFVIPVDNNGNKITNGDASSVAIQIGYNSITALTKVGVDVGLFVGTREASYLIVPDYTDLIFAEPQFQKIFLFESGPLNHISTLDLNGDTAFIDYGGIRSFNATKQLKQESNNTPLSAKIAPLFQGVNQTYTCCIDFDDYGFFAVNTVFGYGILIYDKTLEQFVSFDQYPNVGPIKQFAVVRTSAGRKLLFITTDNKLYEAFGSSETAPASFYLGEWCSNNPSIEQKTLALNTIFVGSQSAGTVTATIFVDRKRGTVTQKALEATNADATLPQQIPYGNSGVDSVQNISFNFQEQALKGWKVGFLLEWNVQASLSHLRVECEVEEQRNNSLSQQAKDFAAASSAS